MSNTWIVDLRHYLNANGAIEIPSGPGLLSITTKLPCVAQSGH